MQPPTIPPIEPLYIDAQFDPVGELCWPLTLDQWHDHFGPAVDRAGTITQTAHDAWVARHGSDPPALGRLSAARGHGPIT